MAGVAGFLPVTGAGAGVPDFVSVMAFVSVAAGFASVGIAGAAVVSAAGSFLSAEHEASPPLWSFPAPQ